LCAQSTRMPISLVLLDTLYAITPYSPIDASDSANKPKKLDSWLIKRSVPSVAPISSFMVRMSTLGTAGATSFTAARMAEASLVLSPE